MNAILGAGPVGLAVAALLQKQGQDFSFWLRDTDRSKARARQLRSSGFRFTSGSLCPPLDGLQVKGPCYSLSVPELLPQVDTLYLCTPHTQFSQVIECLPDGCYQRLVLLNSGLGCTEELKSQTKAECWTFSNFFGAAKIEGSRVVLRALKKNVFLSRQASHCFGRKLRAIGVKVTPVELGLEAEIRNITLYSHAIFGLAPHTLEAVFSLTQTPRYLYKLFPEGPVERRRTLLYANFFNDVMRLCERLGVPGFNLLHFLHHDNYPVSHHFLSELEVQQFPNLSPTRQGDLLYARYTGLLVDPNSTPDSRGRYFDFSAVPVERAELKDGVLRLPRVVEEELYHLTLLRALAGELELHLGAVEHLWAEANKVLTRLRAPWSDHLCDHLQSQSLRAKRLAKLWRNAS